MEIGRIAPNTTIQQRQEPHLLDQVHQLRTTVYLSDFHKRWDGFNIIWRTPFQFFPILSNSLNIGKNYFKNGLTTSSNLSLLT